MSDKKYKLLIVESPSKAKIIEKYLGSEFKVLASKGHIRDLPTKELGIDLENNFQETLVTIPGKESTIKELKEAAQYAEEILLAPDPDREGEAIAFHLQQVLAAKVPVSRVLFHEITKDAIKAAIKNPSVVDQNKYNSQKTRRILDRLVGYKISPILWDKIGSGLSAGRVQTVALRLIVDREDEIRAFKPEEWYSIKAFLKKDSDSFESLYFGDNKKTKKTIDKLEVAEQIIKDIKSKQFILDEKTTKDKSIPPTPPFTTSKIQQEASSKLGFPAKKTMEIAQKLYEGKSLGDKGSQGLITYMRTDSVRSSDKAIDDVRSYIKQTYGDKALSETVVMHSAKKSKDSKVQDAHEAIRPTSLEFSPDVVKPYLSDDEFLLYQLIWKKFISSQMAPCISQQTVYWFTCSDHFFKTSGSVVKEPGFKLIYQEEEVEKENSKKGGVEDEEISLALPFLETNSELEQSKEALKKQNWTQPPARFSEATLIKELEAKGIGRPSTYSAIIENITNKKYIERSLKHLKPSDLGEVLCKMLVQGFPDHFDVKFTARMEKHLDDVAEGEVKYLDVLNEFWTGLSSKISDAYGKIKTLKPKAIPTGLACDKCDGGELEFTWKKTSSILTCKKCHGASPAEYIGEGEFKKIALNAANQKICSKCQGIMQLKDGQYGKFFACSNYPTCNHTMQLSTGVKCPNCTDGEFVEKKAKTGTIYWACNGYPNCKNISWNKPIAQKCIHCLHPLLEDVKGKIKCTKCSREQIAG